jgi:hypothetical protein
VDSEVSFKVGSQLILKIRAVPRGSLLVNFAMSVSADDLFEYFTVTFY